ncbi:universal stress protein [Natronolimnohabitans innermongolicus]|uniref:UspA domain-containing protein n=1 Tax=Natronolimnohabitans innermongolicus JCM 12255 TaxID=1227499 RepID=L9WVH7_9EURY|nr:universal stress protein [Natronolimnohabitans innermongolicus]ELY53191.1 UspA domain-containing protein [Natronolimnohabitans innermongolicus JCM 12255]
MFDTVVVATDGSESVKRAVDVALDLADRFDAEVHALSVVDASEVDASPQQLRDELRTALETTADAALATVEERADGADVITAVREGRPAVELCEYAREVDADLIATGTRGRHGENRLLLGSVAERVVRTSPVPVLTVRQLEPAAATDDDGAPANAGN